MRSIIVLALVLFCTASLRVTAQQHAWPPEAPGPAPIMTGITLGGGKTLPSTQRWNLVWADQIVPSWVTPGQVAFAARNFVGTQKIFRSQVPDFETLNPNWLVLSYHLATCLNPAANNDCPDPKLNSGTDFIGVVAPKGYVSEYTEYFRPWLAAKGIAENGPAFEAMFQHYDAAAPGKRVWLGDPAWLMNLEDANWRAYVTETSLDWLRGNANQGMFFDVAVETNAYLFNPNASNPAPTNFDWWLSPHKPFGFSGDITSRSAFAPYMNQQFLRYFQHLYRQFHAGDTTYLVIPNVDQMITTVYDPVWLDGDANGETIDGAMIESFGHATGGDMYLTLERTIRHITGRGKILIAQSYPASSGDNLRLIGMFMLVKNAQSYVNFLSNSGVEWYPEYEIDLGNQSQVPSTLEALRVMGGGSSGLWMRTYEKGAVLCNTSDAPIPYTLSGSGWSRVVCNGGGDVSADGTMLPQSLSAVAVSGVQVVLPGSCVILQHAAATGIDAASARQPSGLTLYPQPADDVVTMQTNDEVWNIRSIKVYNAIGAEMPVQSTDYTTNGKVLRLDVRGYAPGWYTVLVESGGMPQRVLLLRR
ncbi:MAG: hypothetical protein IPP94_10890 [Ignavibacteria bacterium]|nr:hypothetical protein [Ignavibacteria bacterium]